MDEGRKICNHCQATGRWPIGSSNICQFCGGEGYVTLPGTGDALHWLSGPARAFDLPLPLRLALMLAGIAGGLAAHHYAELPATPPWQGGSAVIGAILGWSLPEGLTRIATLILRLGLTALICVAGAALLYALLWLAGAPIVR